MNQTKKIERANSISGTAPSSSSSSKSPRLQAIDQKISRLSFEKDDDSILSRRKVSLMPLVTEEDLKRNTDLGRKDPEGIAQVFGDDVASRFRYPSTPSSAISPPPYDTKEKMVLRKISPLMTPPLPHETRDLHVPRGVPTVKVRKRRSLTIVDGSLNEATTSTTVFEDVSVALSPVFSQNMSNLVTNYGNTNCFFGTSLDVPGAWQKIGKYNVAIKDYEQFATDIAASNPDMIHFQQVLNQWIKTQSKAQGAAFILLSNEWVSCFCQVADNKLLENPIICGDSSLITNLIAQHQSTSSMNNKSNNSDNIDGVKPPETNNKHQPVIIDTTNLSATIKEKLKLIAKEMRTNVTKEEEKILPPYSLIGIRARSDFTTALFIVHRSKESKDEELSCILPHVQMIGTLMSIVANIEEQKRLARQSQVFLSMTQNVFSSLLTARLPLSSGGNFAVTMNMATLSPSQNCRTTESSTLGSTTSSSMSPSTSSSVTSSINTTVDPTDIASSSNSNDNSNSIGSSVQNGKLSPPVASASLLDRQTMLLTAVTACSSRSRDPVEYSKEMADALKHCHCSKVASLSNGLIPNGKFDTDKPPSDCITPDVCKRLLSLSEDMNLLVRNITKEAKALVQAEICSLFLLDKENSELVAEVFEKNGTSDEYLTEIRMPLNQGIVGHVATTGEMMNVQNVYDHPSFYPKVDERTGFITRNILCFPIKDSSGNLVGVAELCNKIGKPAFTLHDEQIATTFAVYCAISISHCLLYRKLQEAHRRSHMAAELLVQGSTLSIAPEDILRLTVRDIPNPESFHPDFNKFCFVPRSIGTGDTYVEAALSMFKDLGFIDKYRLRRRTLARFLLMVQKGYRDVPYHNWSHAFAVGHFCYLLLRMGDVKSSLTDLERFSLLVACLCHDIDHRGTTNAFQLQSKTPLAQLYSSEGSVLERHHFAQTVTILGMDECNIFEQLTRQQYQQVLDNIREIILATDIAAHLRKVDRIQAMVEIGFDKDSVDHHYLLMCLLMTASDLSDQSKDFKNSKGIAENIYKEFFSQGDLEKQMGNRPIEMMDRERACVPKIQLEFMDTVALPVFRYISDLLPALHETYDSLMINRACWQSLDCILQEEGLPSGGLDYLKDLDLEQKVLDRVGDRGLTWKEEYARKDANKEAPNPSSASSTTDSAESSTTSKTSKDFVPDDKPCSSKSLR